MIRFEKVQFAYPRSSFVFHIARLMLQQGERVALTGVSGSGKTTLLHLAAGLLTPQSGSITTAGCALQALNPRARSAFRLQHIGLVFQSFELLPHLDAFDNILLPIRLNTHRPSGATTLGQAQGNARTLASSLGIEPSLRRRPDQLSQGEQQRVGIARALVAGPQVVLADEPTGNLDRDTKIRAVEVMLDECSRRNATLLMATHDLELAHRFDRQLSTVDLVLSGQPE